MENKKGDKIDRVTSLERRGDERRQFKSKGFAYIGAAGWVCRREKNRRKNDPYRF